MVSRDEGFMALALAMARRGLGRTWPNPAVGAVLVAPGAEAEVLARGWTLPGGRPHAETVALERAGERARGATLYVTLEPCSHHGETPPCADAIAAAGVARVVCGLADPDPRVSGQGLARLREAGVSVETGVLEKEARRVTRGHVLRVTEQRPEIGLKLAVGADGLISRGRGAPVWVTGEQARARAHLMRARADAVLVGRGTVEADDPELTCRLPGMAAFSPVRAVLDTRLRMPETARLLRAAADAPVWVCCAPDAPEARKRALAAAGAEIVSIAVGDDGRPDPGAVAAALAGRGITRLLIEGGPSVARSFLDAGIIERITVFRGEAPAGDGLKPFVNEGLDRIEKTDGFCVNESSPVGPDTMIVYEKYR